MDPCLGEKRQSLAHFAIMFSLHSCAVIIFLFYLLHIFIHDQDMINMVRFCFKTTTATKPFQKIDLNKKTMLGCNRPEC